MTAYSISIDFMFPHSIYTDQLTSLFDADGFELDKTYYRVEPTLDCNQKESVQVSAAELLANFISHVP